MEGDDTGYRLVEAISAWNQLRATFEPKGTRLYDLREIRISPDAALVHEIDGQYHPLATPLPTSEDTCPGFTAGHAEYSSYTLHGAIGGDILVRQDPFNPYLNQPRIPYGSQCVKQSNLPASKVNDSCAKGTNLMEILLLFAEIVIAGTYLSLFSRLSQPYIVNTPFEHHPLVLIGMGENAQGKTLIKFLCALIECCCRRSYVYPPLL